MTVREVLQNSLRLVGSRDTELLLGHVLQKDKVWIYAHGDAEISLAEHDKLRELVGRRANAEPLQYILGRQEFFSLPLLVNRDVLIPRPETEHLVEAVLHRAGQFAKEQARIVDVGTGSGAIALAIASHLPQSEVVAIDVSPEALALAKENARRLGLSGRVKFRQGDLLEGIDLHSVDIVVSNPPYIPLGDAEGMQREVVDHEPHRALFAGPDGLEMYRRLIPQAKAALRNGGLLAMEFGWEQRDSLSDLLREWSDIVFQNDYAGIPRVVLAHRA